MIKKRIKKIEYERINKTVDIVKVVGKVIDLKRVGAYHKGLCPFHEESKPSFVVNNIDAFSNANTFHCFSGQCEEQHGSVIDFVCRYYNLQHYEAIEFLSNEYGLPLDYEEYKLTEEEIRRDYLSKLNAAITIALNKNLMDSSPSSDIKRYLYDRGITDSDIIEWGIGFGDDQFIKQSFINVPFNNRLISIDDLRDIDVLRDFFFTGKVIFPIYDINSNPIAFSNRVFFYDENKEKQKERESELIDKFGKYVNTSIWKKGYVGEGIGSVLFASKSSYLYGLNIARKHIRKEKGTLIVTEGFTDVISCHRHGIRNVAGLMSASFGNDTIKLLEKCHVRKLVFCLDSDQGGTGAVKRVLKKIQQGDIAPSFNIGVATLPEGYDDPDEYLLLGSAEGFRQVISESRCISEYIIDDALRATTLNTLTDRINFISTIKSDLDTSRTLSLLEKRVIIDSLSSKVNVPPEVVKEFLGIDTHGVPNTVDNILSEMIVISELISNEESRPQLLNMVGQDDYSYLRNKILHKMVLELNGTQKPVDFNIITIKGREDGYEGRYYDFAYLQELSQVNRMNVEFHADRIVDLAKKRRLVDIGTRITKSAIESDDMQSVIGNVSKDLYKMNFSTGGVIENPTQESIDYAIEMRRRMEEEGIRHGIFTGLRILDNATQGFFPGQSILILARTSDGKTALAQNMVCHMSLKQTPPIPVYYANMEMPSDQMMDRMMSIYTGIPARSISSGNINDPELRGRLFHAIENYGKRKSLHMQMITDLTINKLTSILKYQIECNGVKLAVVDYVQLMGADKEHRGMSSSDQLGVISNGITGLAKTLNIPIIMIAQANRDTINQNKGRPELHHIYGCDKFSHDVDVAISLQSKSRKKMEEEGFLTMSEMVREGYLLGVDGASQSQYDKFKISKFGNCILHILKNRKGQKDLHYSLFFHKFKITFKEVAESQLVQS